MLRVVAEPRRYQLQNEAANRLIADLLDVEEVPAERRGYYQQLLTTALKLHEDGAGTGDLKITNTALKELRYAYKVYAPYAGVRKVTVFGSARATSSEEATASARLFGKRMTDAGWMVVTGAGAGIMGAAQEGAGGEKSFGLNIRLPFEQEANPWIASDPKLITFKYFFTRKLFLVKEASGVALFPGGFGTMDETFELLTLMQTGKSALVPVVLIEAGPKPYWRIWHRWIAGTLVERGLIDPEDTSLFRIVDAPDEAVAEMTGFYRVYHSSRIVGDDLVFRLTRPLQAAQITDLQDKFADILKGSARLEPGPVPQELNEFPDLPRLILPFDHRSFGRLRQLIDFVNQL
ncbi:MAG: TIGR00730 family Rossman fold protein [Candidatus Rokuibacteriota bacterium]|nr:MAG: TIGR00730 family Rossman fold protein [Candidatus Rokubacteria bacterium]